MKGLASAAARVLLAATLLSATSIAGATVVKFNYADGKGNRVSESPTIVTQIGGLEVTASATNGSLHINGDFGLGVTGDPAGNRIGADESVTFSFAPTTVDLLESIVVERGTNGPSTFELLVDTTSAGLFEVGGGTDNAVEVLDLSALDLTGSVFEFVGVSGNGFRIQELTVQAANAVSEPATLLLMLVGLGGLAAGRRRA